MGKPYFTYQDLMARYGVCLTTIKSWFPQKQRVPFTKRSIRIKEKTVLKFERERERLNGKAH